MFLGGFITDYYRLVIYSMAESAQVKKVSNWMAALSDFMIAAPEARAYEAAAYFGVTEAWLSTVKNSDAFIQFHRARREAHFDRISEDVGDKLRSLAEISLDELTDRVESQRDSLSVQTLHDVGKMAISALGFGSRGGVVINQHNDNRSVLVNDQSALARSRERLALVRKENDEQILQTRVLETVDEEQEELAGEIIQGVAAG